MASEISTWWYDNVVKPWNNFWAVIIPPAPSVAPLSAAPLTASFSESPESGDAPLTVAFSSLVSGGTPQYSYYWDFGDGSNSTAADPSHTYDTLGTYNVKLTVTDAAGSSQSAIGAVSVTGATGSPPPATRPQIKVQVQYWTGQTGTREVGPNNRRRDVKYKIYAPVPAGVKVTADTDQASLLSVPRSPAGYSPYPSITLGESSAETDASGDAVFDVEDESAGTLNGWYAKTDSAGNYLGVQCCQPIPQNPVVQFSAGYNGMTGTAQLVYDPTSPSAVTLNIG